VRAVRCRRLARAALAARRLEASGAHRVIRSPGGCRASRVPSRRALRSRQTMTARSAGAPGAAWW
jgi:hypothetical protein